MKGKIVPEHSDPASVLRKGTKANVTMSCPVMLQGISKTISQRFEFRRAPLSRPKMGLRVVLVASKRGLMTIEGIQTAKLSQLILPARSVYAVWTESLLEF